MYDSSFITTFKSKQSLFFQKQNESVSTSEFCWQIRPYISTHQIQLTDTALLFPDAGCSVFYLHSSDRNLQEISSYKNIIYFSDIVHVVDCHGALEVLLRNGSLCLLSRNSSKRKLIDIFPERDASDADSLSISWYRIRANIQLVGWYINESIRNCFMF